MSDHALQFWVHFHLHPVVKEISALHQDQYNYDHHEWYPKVLFELDCIDYLAIKVRENNVFHWDHE
jgi:hypothetical protein